MRLLPLHLLLIFVAVIMEHSLTTVLTVAGADLSLLAVGIVILSLFGFTDEALWWAVLGGILSDFLSIFPFGLSSLSLLLTWAMMVVLLRLRLVGPHLPLAMSSLAGAGLLVALPDVWISRSPVVVGVSILLHSLVGGIIFILIQRTIPGLQRGNL